MNHVINDVLKGGMRMLPINDTSQLTHIVATYKHIYIPSYITRTSIFVFIVLLVLLTSTYIMYVTWERKARYLSHINVISKLYLHLKTQMFKDKKIAIYVRETSVRLLIEYWLSFVHAYNISKIENDNGTDSLNMQEKFNQLYTPQVIAELFSLFQCNRFVSNPIKITGNEDEDIDTLFRNLDIRPYLNCFKQNAITVDYDYIVTRFEKVGELLGINIHEVLMEYTRFIDGKDNTNTETLIKEFADKYTKQLINDEISHLFKNPLETTAHAEVVFSLKDIRRNATTTTDIETGNDAIITIYGDSADKASRLAYHYDNSLTLLYIYFLLHLNEDIKYQEDNIKKQIVNNVSQNGNDMDDKINNTIPIISQSNMENYIRKIYRMIFALKETLHTNNLIKKAISNTYLHSFINHIVLSCFIALMFGLIFVFSNLVFNTTFVLYFGIPYLLWLIFVTFMAYQFQKKAYRELQLIIEMDHDSHFIKNTVELFVDGEAHRLFYKFFGLAPEDLSGITRYVEQAVKEYFSDIYNSYIGVRQFWNMPLLKMIVMRFDRYITNLWHIWQQILIWLVSFAIGFASIVYITLVPINAIQPINNGEIAIFPPPTKTVLYPRTVFENYLQFYHTLQQDNPGVIVKPDVAMNVSDLFFYFKREKILDTILVSYKITIDTRKLTPRSKILLPITYKGKDGMYYFDTIDITDVINDYFDLKKPAVYKFSVFIKMYTNNTFDVSAVNNL